MMAVKKLVVDYDFDFMLLGLTSSAKDYRIAWAINECLEIELIRQEEVKMEFRDGKSAILISYRHDNENSSILLFRNKMADSSDSRPRLLVPELPHIDYFIRIDGDPYPLTVENLSERLKSLNSVEYLSRFEVETLKSKENLLFY